MGLEVCLAGRKNTRSFQFRILGISSNPNKWAKLKTGKLWPCVSAWIVVGCSSDSFFSSPSMMYTASHTPHAMK